MGHLGRWLSAQVDGELDGAERDRVLNHLAGCQACRQEANALRALKRRMTALGELASDAAIAGRLIERALSGPDLAAARLDRGSKRPRGYNAVHLMRQPWPGWRIASGAAGTALVAIGILAFAVGGGQPQRPVPKVTPAVDVFWVEHSYDTGQVRATGSILNQSPALSGHLPAAARPGPADLRSHSSSP